MIYGKNPLEAYKKNQNFEKVTKENSFIKVAKFVILLGQKEGAKVLKHLPTEEVEQICLAMASIESIGKSEAQSILQEFGVLSSQPENAALVGGMDTAMDILEGAFGKDKANAIMEKVVPEHGPAPFDFLEKVELAQLLHLLKGESSMVLSVVLSQLNPEKVAQVIKTMDAAESLDVVRRIARMEKVDKMVLEAISNNLKDKLSEQGHWESERVDGTGKLAEILKHLDQGSEQRIMQDMADYDAGLEQAIKERLFTLSDLFFLRDRDLQEALQELSEKDVAMLLRDKKTELIDLIMGNLSSRKKQLIKEEDSLMGPVRKSDVETLTGDFIRRIRSKVESGEYLVLRENDFI